MKKQLTAVIAAMLVLSTVSLRAQTSTANPATTTAKKAKPAKVKAETAEQKAIRELQEKEAAQQMEIDTLKQENAAKDAALSAAQSTAATAQSTAATAQSQAATATAQAQSATAAAQASADSANSLKSTVTDLQNSNAGLATTLSDTKKDLNDKIDSPASWHYKGVTITPGGFVAFEGVFRNRSINSDINTPFNSTPFPSANEGHVSELNFSGRQSRLSALVQAAPSSNVSLTGYYEMDWLGTGTTSNTNQSNSYVLRQRQIWGQAALKSGFTVTGGQMWSLVTEMRKGVDPRSEIQPQTIDAAYHVGYSWERQPELRLQQRWGDYKTGAFTAAMSVEQAQITSFTANGTNPAEYFFAGTGQNGGLLNAAAAVAAGNAASTAGITTYANNVAPDFIVKFAYDNPYIHGEVGGVARFLRDYYFPVTGVTSSSPTTSSLGATPTYSYGTTYTSHTSDAGGAFFGLRGYIGAAGTYPATEVAVTGMAGTGVGRYGDSQLADATLKPDETLEPIRNYHGLISIENHLTPMFDIQLYYGGEYAQRTIYTVTTSGSSAPVTGLTVNQIGYGIPENSNAGCYNLPVFSGTAGTAGQIAPASANPCAAPTKYIQEGTISLQFRPITSPKYGRLQYWFTYSYLQRQLWAGVGSTSTPVSPRAENNMLFVSMRYYIP